MSRGCVWNQAVVELLPASDALELFWRLPLDQVCWSPAAVAGVVRSRFSCCGASLTAGLACGYLSASFYACPRQLAFGNTLASQQELEQNGPRLPH